MRAMNRGDNVLITAIACAIASLAGCGGGGGDPDANLIHEADAGPPDAAPPPDSFVCTTDMCPGDVCTDFDTDPLHCGDCTTECTAGQDCMDGGCVCPTYDFIPATLMGNPFGQDMVISQAGISVAVTPYIAAEIDAFGVGYPETGPEIGVPYTLDGSTLPNPPFAIAAFDIDINSMQPRAAFAAVSGTLTFTAACAEGASGTLTNATFQAGTLIPPAVDPEGCTFTVTNVAFSIRSPELCPPPPPPALH
jgi:hypothetical protein